MFFTYEHFYLPLYDSSTLVKRMFMSCILLFWAYFHAYHN